MLKWSERHLEISIGDHKNIKIENNLRRFNLQEARIAIL
jgi:hypothetical protein